MAYNRSYRESEDEKDSSINRDGQEQKVSISEPLTFWIGLIVIAAVLQLIAIPFVASQGQAGYITTLNKFADYILYIPGVFVLPLLASLWIGEIVSKVKSNSQALLYKGLINSVYAWVMYIVAIAIIYITMMAQGTGALASVSMIGFIEFEVLTPFLITIIVAPLFSFLTAAKG